MTPLIFSLTSELLSVLMASCPRRFPIECAFFPNVDPLRSWTSCSQNPQASPIVSTAFYWLPFGVTFFQQVHRLPFLNLSLAYGHLWKIKEGRRRHFRWRRGYIWRQEAEQKSRILCKKKKKISIVFP